MIAVVVSLKFCSDVLCVSYMCWLPQFNSLAACVLQTEHLLIGSTLALLQQMPALVLASSHNP